MYRRTGHRYQRHQSNQHFDGFPRFSDYQTLGGETKQRESQVQVSMESNQDLKNLNKQLISSKVYKQQKISFQKNKSQVTSKLQENTEFQFVQPFQSKQSPILSSFSKQIPSNNTRSNKDNSSIIPPLNNNNKILPTNNTNIIPNPYKNTKAFTDISTIKRNPPSKIRQSDISNYYELLNQLDGKQLQQFIFDDDNLLVQTDQEQKVSEVITSNNRSSKQQIKKQMKQEIQNNPDDNINFNKNGRKSKKNARVSFKQEIQQYGNSNSNSNNNNSKVKQQPVQSSNFKKQQSEQFKQNQQRPSLQQAFQLSDRKNKNNIEDIVHKNDGNIKYKGEEDYEHELELEQQSQKYSYKEKDKEKYKQEQQQQQQIKYKQQQQQIKYKQQQYEYESKSENIKQQLKQSIRNKSQNNNNKKSIKNEIKKQQTKPKIQQQKQEKVIKKKKKVVQVKREKMQIVQNENHRGVAIRKKQKNTRKNKIQKQQEQLESRQKQEQKYKKSQRQLNKIAKNNKTAQQQQQQQQSQRYPKRTRVKPLHYWQNQRIKYQKGKAIAISNTQQLNVPQLIHMKTPQQFQKNIKNFINIRQDIVQAEVKMYHNSQIDCLGYKEPYKRLLVKIKQETDNNHIQVVIDTGIKTKTIQYDQWQEVPIYSRFSIYTQYKQEKENTDDRQLNSNSNNNRKQFVTIQMKLTKKSDEEFDD